MNGEMAYDDETVLESGARAQAQMKLEREGAPRIQRELQNAQLIATVGHTQRHGRLCYRCWTQGVRPRVCRCEPELRDCHFCDQIGHIAKHCLLKQAWLIEQENKFINNQERKAEFIGNSWD